MPFFDSWKSERPGPTFYTWLKFSYVFTFQRAETFLLNHLKASLVFTAVFFLLGDWSIKFMNKLTVSLWTNFGNF